MEWKTFRQLKYLQETSGTDKNCIVMFHGYGADANDLSSLAEALYFSEQMDFLFPQGVETVTLGPGMTGQAWFQLRSGDPESMMTQLSSNQEAMVNIKNVMQQIREWLNHLGGLYKNVFVGGFSQGAVLVSHSFYELNFVPKALLLLSGTLVLPSFFPTVPENLKIPFFQCHGTLDSVLQIQGARKLYKKLSSMGLKGQWHEFQGGHGLSGEMISKLNVFVTDLLTEDPS